MSVLKKLMGAVVALAMPAILAIGSPASASTVNLLTNGDFETGDFTGWTVDDPTLHIQVGAFDGAHVALLDPTGITGFVSQQVATTIGRTYTLSFDLSAWNSNSGPQSFAAGLDLQGPHADTLLTLTSGSVTDSAVDGFNFTNYVLTFTATEALTDLTFAARNDLHTWYFDNVSLTENDVAATPLPGASILYMSGLGLIGFVAWRNKRGSFSRSMAA